MKLLQNVARFDFKLRLIDYFLFIFITHSQHCLLSSSSVVTEHRGASLSAEWWCIWLLTALTDRFKKPSAAPCPSPLLHIVCLIILMIWSISVYCSFLIPPAELAEPSSELDEDESRNHLNASPSTAHQEMMKQLSESKNAWERKHER